MKRVGVVSWEATKEMIIKIITFIAQCKSSRALIDVLFSQECFLLAPNDAQRTAKVKQLATSVEPLFF